MSNEPGPDETLSPNEAHAWSVIERSLRQQLPLRQIERRARLRGDRSLVMGLAGLAAGLALAGAVLLAPQAVMVLALMAAGGCLGVVVVRATSQLLATRSPYRRRRLHLRRSTS
ncbi:MAG: hypothetical protein ACKV2O_07665 [Acidimicrobiales bacterium]